MKNNKDEGFWLVSGMFILSVIADWVFDNYLISINMWLACITYLLLRQIK